MYKYDLDSMEKDGFTTRFASQFLKNKNAECNSNMYSKDLIEKAYEYGFYANHFYQYTNNGTKKINHSDFLNDYDYEKLWPLNDWMRIWVNDKMTLKYMLSHTEFDGVMPKYYFYMSNQGLRSLIDNENKGQTINYFINKLKEVRCFACKPSNGQEAVGFFKLSYDSGDFFLNDKPISQTELEKLVLNRKNYIFSEYLTSGGNLGSICKKIHTIRVMVLNKDGNNPVILPACYIRFGTSSLGEANYVRNDDKDSDDFTIFADVDITNGFFGHAKAFYLDKTIDIKKHPDSMKELTGIIPNWERVCEVAIGISKYLFGVEWMGFDMCIDNEGNPRLMEINTQPGIGYLQVYHPLLLIPEVKDYIERKLSIIKNLTEIGIQTRNKIIR